MGMREIYRRLTGKFGLVEADRVYAEMGSQPVDLATMHATLIGAGLQNVVDEEVAEEVVGLNTRIHGLATMISNSGTRIVRLTSRVNSLVRKLDGATKIACTVIMAPALLIAALFGFIAIGVEKLTGVVTGLIESWRRGREDKIVTEKVCAEGAVKRAEAEVNYYTRLAAKYGKAARK